MSKKFGLILSKKESKVSNKRNSVFGNDSDSDENETGQKRPKIPQKKIDFKSKAVGEVDPSIYEYDSIYDDMKEKESKKLIPKQVKNSRYIESLLKAADKRKKEYERRIERKIQVEREKEGDKFKDKEAFVTSAYKKKMQEREEDEEKERRENMMNNMMDVSKQNDLSGFYRHFLNQTVGEEKVPEFGERDIKQEKVSDDDSVCDEKEEKEILSKETELQIIKNENVSNNEEDKDSDGIEIDSAHSSDEENSVESDVSEKHQQGKKKRFHKNEALKQQMSEFHKNDTETKSKNVCLRRDSDSASDSECNRVIKPKAADHSSSKDKSNLILKPSKSAHTHFRHDSDSLSDNDSKTMNIYDKAENDLQYKSDSVAGGSQRIDSSPNEHKKSLASNTKSNIYTKRTVGTIFADAQARYFQRMAERNLRTS